MTTMLDRLSRINTDLALKCMVALNIATHHHRFDVEQRHTRARRGYLKGDGAWLGCHSDRFRLGDFGGHAPQLTKRTQRAKSNQLKAHKMSQGNFSSRQRLPDPGRSI